jgi:hypothetical protein
MDSSPLTSVAVPEKTEAEQSDKTIVFHYIKAPHFFATHADGVVGGVTPRRLIHMNFYAERGAIPTRVTHKLKSDGTLGDEVLAERQSREGLVRELETSVLMDLKVAVAFRDWLDAKIAILKSEQSPAKEKG